MANQVKKIAVCIWKGFYDSLHGFITVFRLDKSIPEDKSKSNSVKKKEKPQQERPTTILAQKRQLQQQQQQSLTAAASKAPSLNYVTQFRNVKFQKKLFMNDPFHKLKLDSCCLIYHTSESILKSLSSSGYGSFIENIGNSDITSGYYEGGLKLWEGAIDLCHYIDTLPSDFFVNKTVLEAGCGAGLPGILALLKGARHVCFQDYNDAVLKWCTEPNVKANLTEPEGRYELIDGDWVDIILSTETIYCSDYYSRLHNLFKTALKTKGEIFVAAKFYYFGVGGSLPAWTDFVRSAGVFEQSEVWTSNSAVPRKIISLRKRKSEA